MKYAEPTITSEDRDAVDAVLRSGWLTQGPKVEEWEQAVAEYVGAKYAVAFNSATSALYAAYLAVFPSGAKVITTPLTFPATTAMLLNSGLYPVFSDTMEGENVAPVHLTGKFCYFKGKKVVEDASHALGSESPWGKIGNCERSDVCVFSTHAIKNIATGEGGIATTNKAKYRNAMRIVRDHGRWKGRVIFPGWNFRLTDIQAALGLSQLKRIDATMAHKQMLVDMYNTALAGKVECVCRSSLSTHWHLCSICTPSRRKIQRHLADKGIQTAIHYPLVYAHPAYRHLPRKDCSRSEEYALTTLSLPLYAGMGPDDVRTVCAAVLEVL